MKQKFDFIQFEWGFVEATSEQDALEEINNGNGVFVHATLMVESAKEEGVFPVYSPKEILKLLEDLKTAVIWRVEDFEAKATELEHQANCVLFNRTLFEKVLQLMIQRHNADLGISWATVEQYLQNYCKLQS